MGPAPLGALARYDSVDIIHGEHDATDGQRIHRFVHEPKPDRVGRVELVQFNALPIGSSHHREGGPDILQSDQAPGQRSFDCLLALESKAQFDEKRLASFEIVVPMTLSIRLSVISFLLSLHRGQ